MKYSSLLMKQRSSGEQFLKFPLVVGSFTTFVALALYGYLGTFSRYGSDDYCLSAFFLQDNLLRAMIIRYFEASSRYTNILFIGFVDKVFGWYNVAILPALMLALFVLGLYLFLKEIVDLLEWRWSRWMILFLSLLIVYFSITQAPNLYETLYWRAGMTSHFAPLVFIPFFGTFLLWQIRKAKQYTPSVWVPVSGFIIAFLIGGFSEPPTTLMITILFLAVCAAWWWGNPILLNDSRRSEWDNVSYRRSILTILLGSLFGAMAALIVLALAPANSIRLETAPPGLVELISRIIYYQIGRASCRER